MVPDFEKKYLELLKSALCASLYEESAWRLVEGPMPHDMATPASKLIGNIKHRVIRYLRQRNLRLVRTQSLDVALRNEGIDWPLFGFTMTGKKRLDFLQSCIEDVLAKNTPGDFAETGVWRGGSAIFMRAMLEIRGVKDRIVWCADSFEGMPAPDGRDAKLSANFSGRPFLTVSLDQVKANFERFGLLDNQVRFVKGWFKDTLPSVPIGRLAILRLDGDLYESTRDALVALYEKVSPGGFVIVDDYRSWPGCRTAVDEFITARKIASPLVPIDASAVFWQKCLPDTC